MAKPRKPSPSRKIVAVLSSIGDTSNVKLECGHIVPVSSAQRRAGSVKCWGCRACERAVSRGAK
jgi:hypothetical protein